MNIDLQSAPIPVAGHRGFVRSAVVRRLEALGARNLILRSRSELDLADAIIFLLERHDDSDIVNIGTGTDVSIRELAEPTARVTGFDGEIDTSKPDGTPRKLLDVSRLEALGWSARILLETGIRSTLKWYLANHSEDSMDMRGSTPAST